MKLQHLVSAAIFAALSFTAANAAPMIQFGNDTGSSVDLQIVTDANGSIAAELAVEIVARPGLTLTNVTPNLTEFRPNPGDNPFIAGSPIGGDTTGLFTNFAEGQVFASYGSNTTPQATPAGTYTFLTLDYEGAGSLAATGLVAQLGVIVEPLSARIDLVPEPTSALLAMLGLAGFAMRRRCA